MLFIGQILLQGFFHFFAKDSASSSICPTLSMVVGFPAISFPT
jgi:hypothetical protein